MSDTRSQIGEALQGKLSPEQLTTLMDEVLAIKKSARGWCKHCNGAVVVEIADAKGVTGALVDLANQAWGRPQDDKQEDASITLVRKIVYGGEPDVAA